MNLSKYSAYICAILDDFSSERYNGNRIRSERQRFYMVEKIRLVPTTETSHPFARADVKCNFKENGYVEDEYFVYGKANLYDANPDERPVVIAENVPYVNRMLVRRPADPARFSGNVVIELLNPTAHIDIDRIWVNTWRYFVRHGDIYIGIVSKPDVFDSLYTFDKERYGEINWPNPLPDRKEPEGLMFPLNVQWENGLLWDIMTDCGKILRRNDELNPIAAYMNTKVYLYMTGWSQCTGFINRYVRSFAQTKELKGIFDGYLNAGGGAKLTPINSYANYARGGIFGMEGWSVFGADVPFIALNTESENKMAAWGDDSDVPGDLFRSYQMPGSSHDEKNNLDDWYRDDPDLAPERRQPYRGLEGEVNNYPYTYLFHMTMARLYAWVRDGVPAPHMPRIEMERIRDEETGDYHYENLKDAFGNAKGGIRTAALDLPTARYYNWCNKPQPDGTLHHNWLYGHADPFSPALMKELYGSLENYRALVAKSTALDVQKGFVLPEDEEDIVNEIVQMAEARGLH